MNGKMLTAEMKMLTAGMVVWMMKMITVELMTSGKMMVWMMKMVIAELMIMYLMMLVLQLNLIEFDCHS